MRSEVGLHLHHSVLFFVSNTHPHISLQTVTISRAAIRANMPLAHVPSHTTSQLHAKPITAALLWAPPPARKPGAITHAVHRFTDALGTRQRLGQQNCRLGKSRMPSGLARHIGYSHVSTETNSARHAHSHERVQEKHVSLSGSAHLWLRRRSCQYLAAAPSRQHALRVSIPRASPLENRRSSG